ncbi:Inverted formin-2 [Mactra antiquata]
MTSKVNLRDFNNTSLELQQDLARSTPKQCVTLTHSVPSVQMYCALRSKLDSCSDKWLQEFLHRDGLDSLLDALYQMSSKGFVCFSDAILQMDCLSCIRCILNTSFGLDYFINNDLYTRKLTMGKYFIYMNVEALNCSESLPKKQVLEMLSAVCVYNNIGYLRVIEGLSYLKTECDQLHKFSVIVRDLRNDESVAFKTALMTFINAIINCTPTVMDRIRIRNEFIGLNILDMMSYIRKEEPDEHLLLQLEVFHERKLTDEESMSADNNIDLNSPQYLQEHIQDKIFGTPKMASFVNILQDLLAIETVYSDNSAKLWQTVDNLVHHVIHTMESNKLDTIQSDLQQFPEHLGLGIQCLLSYQSTAKLKTMSSVESGISSSKSCPSADDNDNGRKCNNLQSSVCKMDQTHVVIAAEESKHDTLGSSGNSYESNSSSHDNSQSQNRTVTIFRNDSTNKENLTSSSSSVNDKTVILKERYCSPTELTFFSNQFNETSSPLLNDCSRSGYNGESVYSPCNDENNSSISSKLSSHGNKTYDKSDSNDFLGMNINLPENKAYEYDQQKVKDKLLSLYSLSPEDKSEIWSGCSLKGRMFGMRNKCTMGVGGVTKSPSDREMFTDIKYVNSIVRPDVPEPTKPLHSLKWITLPDEKIVGREPCVWLPTMSNMKTLDFNSLENAFSVVSPEYPEAIEEIVLLSATTRLKINLLLSRLDSGAEDLIHLLDDGNQTKLTLPMFQYLTKILPSRDEVAMLRNYSGPRLELGMAEQFILLLSDQPDYQVLLEGHTMRLEFDTTVKQFKISLDTMIKMARLIISNTEFKQLLHLILYIGNYLNFNQYHGSCSGFTITSLERLQELKSIVPNRTLLHHVVLTMTENNKSAFDFIQQIMKLEKAASFSMEDMKTEISKLNSKLIYFMNNLSYAGKKVQTMFQPFIESLKKEFSAIQSMTTELRNLTDQLASYFCEDETRFNLQGCFKCIINFCKDLQKCQMECTNVKYQVKKETVKIGDVMKNKLKSKLLSLEFGQSAGASSSMMEEKTKMVDKIVNQLHQGNFNPCIKSELPTPDKEVDHPLEMSCIPHVASPSYPVGIRNSVTSEVFIATPELVCASYGTDSGPKMMRSSTQKMKPVKTICTAQTTKPYIESKKPIYIPSPIKSETDNGWKSSATLQRRLFPMTSGNEEYQEREITDVKKPDEKVKRQLELPSRRIAHRRSRSDMLDSISGVDKWIEYEKTREHGGRNAPLAEPESWCNLSTLHLENKGKFVTNKDFDVLKTGNPYHNDARLLEDGPEIRLVGIRDKKGDKKSSKGGFFSKLGRAVLKPRNHSDGDQNNVAVEKLLRKKYSKSDKENTEVDPLSSNEKLAQSDKNKTGGNTNKVSRFFQRGGLYRSSKMKKKNQNLVQ